MIIGLLVGSTFLLTGLFVLFWSEKGRRLTAIAGNWPWVMGQICESRVSYARPNRDDYDCLVFSYRYHVDGASHIGKSVGLFGLESKSTIEEMEKIVQTYPKGSPVKIHYDANDPSRSVIEPENRLAYTPNRNLGALLTIAGIATLAAMSFT